MDQTAAPRRQQGFARAADWLAPPITLAAPFVHFLRYYEYGLTRPESLVLVAILATAGLIAALAYRRGGWAKVVTAAFLITLFVEAKFPFAISHMGRFFPVFLGAAILCRILLVHLAAIQFAVFATILLTTIVLPVETLSPVERRAEAPAPDTSRPVVVHLVLDEHAGVEAIPEEIPGGPELRKELAETYVGAGFRLFGRAHSEYFYSKNSLSHLVNLEPDYRPGLATDRRGIFEATVTRNRYFHDMAARGYRISVYQPDYMDFCGSADPRPWLCHTYRPFQLKPVAEGPWSMSAKLRTLAGFYLTQSGFYEWVRRGYYLAGIRLKGIGVSLPEWNWELTRLPALAVMDILDRIEADLARSRGGELFFFHAMLPHSPYAYAADCSIVSPDQWLERRDRVFRLAESNTPEMRAARYQAYIAQTRCLTRRLGRLFRAADALSARVPTILMVHGDHGSRINIRDPRERYRDVLSPSDYVDNYATLLAIRGPAIPACYDGHPISLQDLVAGLVPAEFTWPPQGRPYERAPTVHLASDASKEAEAAVPMVPFGNGRPPAGVPPCER